MLNECLRLINGRGINALKEANISAPELEVEVEYMDIGKQWCWWRCGGRYS